METRRLAGTIELGKHDIDVAIPSSSVDLRIWIPNISYKTPLIMITLRRSPLFYTECSL